MTSLCANRQPGVRLSTLTQQTDGAVYFSTTKTEKKDTCT